MLKKEEYLNKNIQIFLKALPSCYKKIKVKEYTFCSVCRYTMTTCTQKLSLSTIILDDLF